MKNKLTDLNNHLFLQLERLGEDELTSDALQTELLRAGAIALIAREVISAGKLALEAEKAQAEYPLTNAFSLLHGNTPASPRLEDQSNV